MDTQGFQMTQWVKGLATKHVTEFSSEDPCGGMENSLPQAVFCSPRVYHGTCMTFPRYVNIKIFLNKSEYTDKQFSKRPMPEEIPVQYLNLVLFDFHKVTNNPEMELKVALKWLKAFPHTNI